MNPFRSSYWSRLRRPLLIVAVIVLGYRSYGDSIARWFQPADPVTEIVITHSEFRPEVGGERPVWILRLYNSSSRNIYDRVVMEATYVNIDGVVTEKDQIIINQRLNPREEKEIPSRDPKPRINAARATLKVINAQVVN